MPITGEFRIPRSDFPLRDATATVPAIAIELIRVTITPSVLSPFFWARADDIDAFNRALADDPSVTESSRVDTFGDAALYRVTWDVDAENVASLITRADCTVLRTVSDGEHWYFRIQFPDRAALAAFRETLVDAEVDFTVTRLFDSTHPSLGSAYGLTPKQSDAIVRALEMGYYESPRTVGLSTIADEMGISPQALSDRLRRGHLTLVRNTLARGSVMTEEDASGAEDGSAGRGCI